MSPIDEEQPALGGGSDLTTSEGQELDQHHDDEAEEQQQPEQASHYNVADALDPQNPNIADLFNDTQLKEISRQCIEEFDIDNANFAGRRERIEQLYKLALQVKEQKNYPFEKASNIKYPLLTKAALKFAELAFPAIVRDDSVVKSKIIGSDEGGKTVKDGKGNDMLDDKTQQPIKINAGQKARRGARVAKFMSNQILDKMDGWEDDMDKLLHVIPIVGLCWKKTIYDHVEQEADSRLVLPQYLILNIDAKTIESCSRASEIFEMYPNEIEENIRLGIFRKFDYDMTSTETMTDSYKPLDSGGGVTSADKNKPHQFIEQHRWLDLDDDGYQEPYKVKIHKDSGEVASIEARFDREDIVAGKSEPDAAGIVVFDDIKKISAQCEYEKFGFIPDPEGSIYDIGFGHLTQDLNEGANTSINQIIDAGHRNIMGGGFIGAGVRLKGGAMRFQPGEYKRADSQGAALKDNIVPLPQTPEHPIMFQLLEFLINAAESITVTANGIEPTASAQPATTTLAMVEQGLQSFKAIFKRVHRGLKKEFKRLYYLNSKYLTQDEYMAILDDPDADVKADFDSKDFSISPISDPDMVNNIERLMRANILAGFKDDPLCDPIEIRQRIFRAANIEDVEKIVKIPVKAPDELVEAQKAQLDAMTKESMAKIEKMNRDNERQDIETALNIEKTMSEIQVNVSTAVLNLGKANQADAAIKIDTFMANLTSFEKKAGIYANVIEQRQRAAGAIQQQSAAPANNSGNAGNVAPEPDDKVGSPVPA